MFAYHFVGDTLRDGRSIPADGEWLEHTGPVTICETGLHASLHPFDALQYAPGSVLCLVECEDIVTAQDDKLVCRRRRIVKRIDATKLMRQYACICALSVIDKWDAPDVVRRYLETGDKSIREAARGAVWDAARDAAWAAAMGAAWDAAWDAARHAARAAAWDAARAAAWDAARAAARDAAWDAAWHAARHAARAAAWAAARAAAWDAARDVHKQKFLEMVEEAFNV
jgi:hypothetical protein